MPSSISPEQVQVAAAVDDFHSWARQSHRSDPELARYFSSNSINTLASQTALGNHKVGIAVAGAVGVGAPLALGKPRFSLIGGLLGASAFFAFQFYRYQKAITYMKSIPGGY